MIGPIQRLAAIAVRHVEEEPNAILRASILEAAAGIFTQGGEIERAQQLTTTAAVIREADRAQLHLRELFKL